MSIEFTINGKKVKDLGAAFGRDLESFVEDGVRNHVGNEIANMRCDLHPEFVPRFTLENLNSGGRISACCESFKQKLQGT